MTLPPRSQRRGGARRARIETSAGGVVCRRDGGAHVLLIRDPYMNWGLPKGHIEGGETPAEAAVREVREETGLADVVVLAPLPTIDWYFRDRGRLVHKFCHFFLLETLSGEPVPQLEEGITECVWLALEEAMRTVSYANAREVIRAAGTWLTATCD
jgi:8-oxo-dGTP pyrophosphatase MutT (NUDIX family)